jgi:hypothetical protein
MIDRHKIDRHKDVGSGYYGCLGSEKFLSWPKLAKAPDERR